MRGPGEDAEGWVSAIITLIVLISAAGSAALVLYFLWTWLS